jgi:TonB-dependent receptor
MKNLFGIIRSVICSLMNITSCRFSMRALVIGGIICIFMTQSLIAAGTIKGRVFDKNTNDALPAANLLIKGTSVGAAADLHGVYTIFNAPSGEQTMVVSYIGYATMSVVVTVPEDGTIQRDIGLEPVVLKGEQVVITAQAMGQIEAINTQLRSNTITNVVSSEKIHQLPDADAATALSRLPGLSLMNGDQIVIRGVQAKQNLVLVNGIQLPSTDINTRATNLGFISSNMLSGIEVVKVLTPDMDANAIGGVVNLRLREAPSNFHFDMLSQGGTNHQERTWGNYKFWASASNRFLNDKLGVFLQGNANRADAGDDRTTAAYAAYESRPYGQAPYQMNTFTFNDQQNVISTFGGSLILDYMLPHGKIMLQNTISKGINDNASHNTQLDFANNRIIYSLNRDKYNRRLLANALQTEYNFGDIKAELILSHSFSDKKTDIRYGDAGDNTNFSNPSPGAVWGYNDNGGEISYSETRRTMTHDEVLDVYYNPDDYKSARISDWTVMREEAFEQRIYNAQLDFTIPVSFSKYVSSTFKTGGKFIRTTRENDLDRWYRRVGDENFFDGVSDFIPGKTLSNTNRLLFTDVQNTDYNRGEYFLDGTYDFKYAFDIDKLDDFYSLARRGWGPSSVHKEGSVRYDFNGAEIFTAGYLMGNFSIGPRLSLIAGGRYEHYNMDYDATNFYTTHPVDGNGKLLDTLNTVDRNDDNFFPNTQFRYKFTDWSDLRLAYSKAISRPDYQAILPNTLFSPGLTSVAGNPKLKPTISNNLDAYLSFYNNEIGLFTIGGFYKKMDNIFFQTNIAFQNISYYNITFPDSAFWRSQVSTASPEGIKPPTVTDVIQTWINNPHPAYIKGLELEWQTHFWYLPQPLNSLVLNANYTRVWSEMDYQQLRNIPIYETVINPITHRPEEKLTRYNTIDTVRTARLLNQGDDIINIAMGIDYKDFSGRISLNLQGNVITTVGGRPEDDQFTGNIYRWDFTLKQNLPIEGLSIQLSGINIFHNVTETYRKFRREEDGRIFDNLLGMQYSPRVFELNLRYTM